MIYEEAFLEGYLDALDTLTESSSVQDYLNHHSSFGDLFSNGIASGLNAHKKSQANDTSLGKLYLKYIRYCEKKGIKPQSKESFVSEGRKYYKQKKESSYKRIAANALLGYGNINNMVATRSGRFKEKAGMKDDYTAK